jgi:hypothetical protein
MAIVTKTIVGDNPTPSAVYGHSAVHNVSTELDLSELRTGFTTGDSVNIAALPQGAIILAANVINVTALTGTVTRIDLGDVGDDDRFVTNFTTTTAGASAPVVAANVPFAFTSATAANRILQLKIAASAVSSLGGIIQVNYTYLHYPQGVTQRTTIPEA